MNRQRSLWTILAFAGISLSTVVRADVIPVGVSTFPASSTLITFDGLATGVEVNGLLTNGVRFSYTVGGAPLNGAVEIDGGPGNTNNIAPQNIVSVGNDAGVLGVTLPTPISLFGYGFAILAGGTVANATTISAFNGATLLGSVSFSGSSDPTFTGGFAGISSTTPFDRVSLTFNSTIAPAFAVDNIRFSNVPEPSTLLLTTGAGLLAGGCLRRRSRAGR